MSYSYDEVEVWDEDDDDDEEYNEHGDNDGFHYERY